MTRLAGKTAIITGAGSGIGRATTRLFAAEGAKVLAVDLNEEGLKETRNGCEALVTTRTADAADEGQVASLVSDWVEAHGRLDVFYANAGVSGGSVPLFDQTVEEWQRILNINLVGPFLAVKYAGQQMVKQGHGSLICTASVAGLRANAGGTPYSASKAGVISLVQTVSHQLYRTGVRINAICPGLIETGMTRPIFEGARARGTEDRIGQLNPTGRYGEPVEIANMALFLASDESSYVNGQAFPVDGGLSASHPFVVPRH